MLSISNSYGQNHAEDKKPKVDLRAVPLDQYQLSVSTTTERITIDGTLDETTWLTADSVSTFYQNYPFDTGYAVNRTVVRISKDEDHLYISAVCYDALPGRFISTSLARDWSHRETDGFEWFIDPFQDRTNGFGFGVSAYNAQRDGLVSNGGNGGMNAAWDNKWYSEVKHYPDRWVVEVSIPFKSLRYKGILPYWHINFARTDYKRNELSIWVPMFRNFSISNLGYAGKLMFDKPVAKKGANISLIPYGALNATQDFRQNQQLSGTPNFGLDAKVGLGTAMNLDLTANPDFSQVDVDQQVTNLSRFELFFPERRNFFLENQDLFDAFGTGRNRPFFSRRIGIVYDSSLRLYVNNPILFGARLSGKLDQNWRLGILATQTANNQSSGNNGQNNIMFSLQRRVFSRSFVSGFIINRQGFGDPSQLSFAADPLDFSRNGGLEFNLVSADNRFTGKIYQHFSQRHLKSEQDLTNPIYGATGGTFGFNERNFSASITSERTTDGYSSEMGFLPRNNYWYNAVDVFYNQLIKHKWLASVSGYANADLYMMPDSANRMRRTDQSTEVGIRFSTLATRYLTIAAGQNFTYLFRDFTPTNRPGDQRLAAGTGYDNSYVRFSYQDDLRNKFYFTMNGLYGGYYNGNRLQFDGSANYRFMPYVALGLSGSVNQLYLPEQWGNPTLWLVGPNMNVTLTNSLFFRAFYQVNSQIDNMNINARLQWRYQPASDLFIVYTSNYSFLQDTRIKNNALVVKLTYWFNA